MLMSSIVDDTSNRDKRENQTHPIEENDVEEDNRRPKLVLSRFMSTMLGSLFLFLLTIQITTLNLLYIVTKLGLGAF